MSRRNHLKQHHTTTRTSQASDLFLSSDDSGSSMEDIDNGFTLIDDPFFNFEYDSASLLKRNSGTVIGKRGKDEFEEITFVNRHVETVKPIKRSRRSHDSRSKEDRKIVQDVLAVKKEKQRQEMAEFLCVDENKSVLQAGWVIISNKNRWIIVQYHQIEIRKNGESGTIQTISLKNKEIDMTDDVINIIDFKGDNVLSFYCSSEDAILEWFKNISFIILHFRSSFLLEDNILTENEWLYRRLKIFIGTWNVGNTRPPEDLSPWLKNDDYDIIVIGAQECQYTSKDSGDDWYGQLEEYYKEKYTMIGRLSLWEIRNSIFVKNYLVHHITEVKTCAVPTGIANTLGNKGGTGISFKIHDSTFCFISSHLAAHMADTNDRNIDYKEIIKDLSVGKKSLDVTNQFDYCFWVGDLNYRLEDSREYVISLIEHSDFDGLYSIDQLKREMDGDRVFSGFTELMDPQFNPTYRYLRNYQNENGEREYNDEKERVPSWCDRILYKSAPCNEVSVKEYDCCNNIITSDHSPVYGVVQVKTRISPVDVWGISKSMREKPTLAPVLLLKELECNYITTLPRSHSGHYISFKFYLPFENQFQPVGKTGNAKVKSSKVRFFDAIPYHLTNFERQYIQSHFLIICVNYRYGHGKNKYPLGQGMISLTDACGSSAHNFQIPIYYQGRRNCIVKGKLQITNTSLVSPNLSL